MPFPASTKSSLAALSALSISTANDVPLPSANIVLLRYEERRPMATVRKESLSEIEEVAREYTGCPVDARLKFHTKLSGVGNDEFVDIDPVLWPHIHNTVTSLWIEMDPKGILGPNPQSPIRIFVVIWSHKTICIRINAGASVAALKAMIQNKVNIQPDRQRLCFRGSEMGDDRRLDSYGINQDSGVFLTGISRGASLE